MITKPAEQLAREDMIRQTLEAAARRLEHLTGNATYKQAWRVAARSIRSMSLDDC